MKKLFIKLFFTCSLGGLLTFSVFGTQGEGISQDVDTVIEDVTDFLAEDVLDVDTGAEATQETQTLEEITMIRVGYLPNSPLVKNIESIDRKGFGYDLLRAAEQYSDIRFDFVPVHEENIISSFRSGVIDVFGGISWQEEYEDILTYSQDFGFMQVLLLADKDSSILYEDAQGMDGKTVTVLDDFAYTDMLFSYLEKRDIQVSLEFVSHTYDLYRSENALILGSNFMDLQDKKIVAYLGAEPIYFVALEGNEVYTERIDEVLSILDERQPWTRYGTYTKYFSESDMAKPVLTGKDFSLLQEHGVYTVGVSADLYPLEGVNEDGEPVGIMVDLMNTIGEYGGISLEYVPFTLEDDFNYDDFDLCLAYVGTDEYYKKFFPSEEIVGSPPLVLVSSRGLTEPKTEMGKIGVLPYTTFDFDVIYEKYPFSDILLFHTYEELLTALETGLVDGLLVSNITSWYLLEELGQHYDSYFTGLFLPLRLYVSQNLPTAMVGIFNRLLGQLDGDMVEKLMLDQVSVLYDPPTFLDDLVKYWYIGLLSGLGALLLYGILTLERRKKAQEAFLHGVNEDALTGLYSEVKFIDLVQQRMKELESGAYRMYALDIDQFSLINRQYGNHCGNLILQNLANRLSFNFPEESILCRSHGDLFYIFTPTVSDLRASCGKAFCDECVVACASSVLMVHYPLSISRGYYLVDDLTETVEEMMSRADMARKLGKGTYGLTTFGYSSELEAEKNHEEVILSQMWEALHERALRVHYQVKVELETGKISGGEALVRWYHLDEHKEPLGVRFYPEEFMRLFEENGFVGQLDYYVFEEVCRLISSQRGNPYFPKLAVNLSGVTLLRTDLLPTLEGICDRYQVYPEDIDLEITESAFISYTEGIISRVQELTALGYRIGMDDFGTGASSLSRLKDLEIDFLKLDKSFLDYNLQEKKGSIIVGNMISMAKRIGVSVIAEGVETLEQVEALRELACDQVQGYYYSKPRKEEEFLEICREGLCLSHEKRKFLIRTNRYEEHGGVVTPWSGQI